MDVIATILAIAAVTLSIITYVQMRRTHSMDAMFRVFELVNSSDVRAARKTLYEHQQDLRNPHEQWSEALKGAADTAGHAYELMAVSIQCHSIDTAAATEVWSGSCIRVFELVRPHIEAMRRLPDPAYDRYWNHFESFYRLCCEREHQRPKYIDR